ncbi:hypothetical protein vBRpoSV10_15 [Ruegeria phage vB_RpoS-V10]|nr:hypothetical protein DSS3P8_016 [Roseobacter phage DSS3P8]AWY09137.1 hypothetical protein vBRpoSV10_15 [Ruegeria phage vB_RpoS-V10]
MIIDDRDWSVDHNGSEVLFMFDANASETFDPTDAVEVVIVGGLFKKLSPGDKITFTFNG